MGVGYAAFQTNLNIVKCNIYLNISPCFLLLELYIHMKYFLINPFLSILINMFLFFLISSINIVHVLHAKLYSSVVVLNWAWQKFVLKNKDKNKIINCDEGWYFLKYKEAANFLADVGRRGRKYHTALYIGSQFIDEFIRK